METTRFLLDLMLGKLATYLRMCGYDTKYAGDIGISDDDVLIRIAETEDRVLVSRDEQLIAGVDRGILIHSRDVADQLSELRALGHSFTLPDRPLRCGRCNGRLERASPDVARPEYVPPPEEHTSFRCRRCGQYFWRGSHVDDVAKVLSDHPPE